MTVYLGSFYALPDETLNKLLAQVYESNSEHDWFLDIFHSLLTDEQSRRKGGRAAGLPSKQVSLTGITNEQITSAVERLEEWRDNATGDLPTQMLLDSLIRSVLR